MIEWIPINDWEIKAGEEFLVIVENDIQPGRTIRSATYRGGEFDVCGFPSNFMDRPECTYKGSGGVCRITYAAKADYPKSLHDKFMEYDRTTGGTAMETTTKFYDGLVRIVEEHYKGKK